MTNAKATRRALLSSVVALVLCFTMLMGTTFAWFTDSVSSVGNKIQSGTLDIVLEMYDKATDTWVDAEGKMINFVAADGRPQEDILWEPGATYEMQPIRVRNKGNLAVSFKMIINGIDGDSDLLDVITFTTTVGNLEEAHYNAMPNNVIEIDGEKYLKIAPIPDTPYGTILWDENLVGSGEKAPNNGLDDTSGTIVFSAHMLETAGNEYQNLYIEGISITVIATQETYEYDSFNNQYDAGAEYDINNVYIGNVKYDTIANAVDAANDGDTIRLTAGTFYEAVDLKGKSLTLQGAGDGATIIAGPKDYTTTNIPMLTWAGWGADSNVYALISANRDVTIKDLTVSADPTQIGAVGEFRQETNYAFVGIHVQSANATIENVSIKNIMPDTVTGNDHHNFGLYITSAINDSTHYEVTYKNGTVSNVNRGGIYCWSDKYTLKFEDVTVIGPGNIANPNGTLTPAEGSDKYIYAFCPFYVCSPTTYENVVVRDSYRVSWGGANWNGWANDNWATNPPAGVTCINCGIAD